MKAAEEVRRGYGNPGLSPKGLEAPSSQRFFRIAGRLVSIPSAVSFSPEISDLNLRLGLIAWRHYWGEG